ncbi:protein disulfide oxidoreductase [Vibrio gallaecicus]|uniref:protein disulfide oxidoreductase n=1 Tax=Vibrio gallaecicus TaxID=552386 RepID=UPI0010C9879C|nr:protein disulfide oxidoreductase [Vibrio gallaecicus]MDN3616516.1 protein disulfide oxidoreductase [Vibrio gallaecicus]
MDKHSKDSHKNEKPSRVKKWAKELVYIILIVGIVSYAMDFYHSAKLPTGAALPISGMTVQGEFIDVIEQSKSGEPVIVYFWATWCGACKFVSPTINWFANDHQVVTVALSSGEDERVRRFLSAKEYDFPVLNDATGNLNRDWKISVTPTIVIIKDGEIKHTSTGVTTPWGLWFRTLFV